MIGPSATEATKLTSSHSTFTPVPKHVQDGSEDNIPVPAAITSGAPIELQARTVQYVRRSPFPSQ